MRKWIGPLISPLLILILGITFVFGAFINLERRLSGKTKTERHAILLVQDEREKGDADPHMLQVWREIQRKLDEWLRNLNDRIESEDVTRFAVRFLEMIRNVLEWTKEKVDGKVESYQKGKPIREEKSRPIRDTRLRDLRFSKMG